MSGTTAKLPKMCNQWHPTHISLHICASATILCWVLGYPWSAKRMIRPGSCAGWSEFAGYTWFGWFCHAKAQMFFFFFLHYYSFDLKRLSCYRKKTILVSACIMDLVRKGKSFVYNISWGGAWFWWWYWFLGSHAPEVQLTYPHCSCAGFLSS